LDIILIASLDLKSSYCLYQIFHIDSIETSEPDNCGIPIDSGTVSQDPEIQSIKDRQMKKGDPTVSVDLLVKSLLALGADRKSIARAIASHASQEKT
jgi:hypothetical protein